MSYLKKTKRCAVIFSWGLYDLANQFFALNVVSLYFVRWVTIEKGMPDLMYSVAFGLSILTVAISAPVLGALSDATREKRPFLVYFTLLSVLFTALLGILENVYVALLFFAVANYGCQTAVIFYNSQIADIAPKGRMGLVSGLGRMMGYSGAIVALYLMKPIVLEKGYQAVFIPTGILFLVFALPCLIFVKDRRSGNKKKVSLSFSSRKVSGIFRRTKKSISDLCGHAGVGDYMKSAFFVLCPVNVMIVFMAVYATRVLGLDDAQVIDLIAFSTLFAIAGSIVSGYMSDRLGEMKSLVCVLILWSVCFTAAAFIRAPGLYRLIGGLIGVSLGAVWVILRVMAVKLVPPERIGEAFGLFNIVNYTASATGTVFWGLSALIFSGMGEWGYRMTVLSLNGFLVPSFLFLMRVRKKF